MRGFEPVYSRLFVCTVNSEQIYFLILTHFYKPGLIFAGFQRTSSIRGGFQEAFRADSIPYRYGVLRMI